MSPKQSINKNTIWFSIVKWVLGVILAIISIWLLAGVIFNLLTRTYLIRWAFGINIFPFSTRIGSSLLLLILIAFTFIAYGNKFWEWTEKNIMIVLFNDKIPGKTVNQSRRIRQILGSIILIVFFYAILLLVTKQFPIWTGYTFKSDWALLAVVSVPLFVFGVVFIFEIFPKITAKVGGIEIGLEKTIASSLLESPLLQYSDVQDELEKKRLRDLKIIRQAIAKGKRFRILTVSLNDRINLITLRHYVYELSKITPLEYIVFIGDKKLYLGFLTVTKFKERFPKYNLEILLDDYPIYPQSDLEGHPFNFWEQTIGFHLENNRKPDFNQIRKRLLLNQWRPHNQIPQNDILDDSLFYIGFENIEKLYLDTGSVSFKDKSKIAYKKMLENGLPGIPVIDGNKAYLGIITKEAITDKIVSQLLEQAKEIEE